MHRFNHLAFRLVFAILLAGLTSACGALFDIEPDTKTDTHKIASDIAAPSPEIAKLNEQYQPSAKDLNETSRSTVPQKAELYPAGKRRAANTGSIAPVVKSTSNGDVSFNFVDTPITEVVSIILGDTLGIGYILDTKVQGTVTIRTGRPVKSEAVLAILEEALALADVAMIPEDNRIMILPLSEAGNAPRKPSRAARRGQHDFGFGVHVMPLQYASAGELVKILRGFITPGRNLHADNLQNLLIYSGTSNETVDLFEMISFFDVDWMVGTSYAILPVHTAKLDDVISELEAVFNVKDGGGDAAALRLLPIERMSSILAITTQPAYLGRLKTWVERLDRGENGDGQRVYIYRVQHGRAAELADVLTQLADTNAPRQRRVEELAPGSKARTESRTASSESSQAVQADSKNPPNAAGGNSAQPAVIKTGPATRFANNPSAGTAVVASGNNPPRIIADEANNALVILATPAQHRMLQDTLAKLDTTPLQVMIEATIAEVILNDDLKFGVEWFFARGDLQGGLVNNPLGQVGLSFPGFSLLFNDGNRLAALSALAEVTDVNVISSPQLMVLNNQTASLQVGDQVPIATQSSVSTSDLLAPTVNSIEYRDTGVVLEVTPRVNTSGHISVDIVQEVSDVTTTSTSTIDSPTIRQRKIASAISMRTGQTVALGGLIRDTETEGESGVPFLMDIPILGHLFKTSSSVRMRTELLVLITMHIVRDPEDSRLLTEDLRRRFQSLRPLEHKLGKPLRDKVPNTKSQ